MPLFAERGNSIAFEEVAARRAATYWLNNNITGARQAQRLKNEDPIKCDSQPAPYPVATAGVRYFHATNAVSKHSTTPAPSQKANHGEDCVTTHRTTRHMPDAAPASQPKMLTSSDRFR